jgi:hypothetical protein
MKIDFKKEVIRVCPLICGMIFGIVAVSDYSFLVSMIIYVVIAFFYHKSLDMFFFNKVENDLKEEHKY